MSSTKRRLGNRETYRPVYWEQNSAKCRDYQIASSGGIAHTCGVCRENISQEINTERDPFCPVPGCHIGVTSSRPPGMLKLCSDHLIFAVSWVHDWRWLLALCGAPTLAALLCYRALASTPSPILSSSPTLSHLSPQCTPSSVAVLATGSTGHHTSPLAFPAVIAPGPTTNRT